MKVGVLLLLGVLLTSCARSPNAQFYTLTPLPFKTTHSKPYQNIRIGISEVNLPAYLSKPEIVVRSVGQQVDLKNFHQWAGSLSNNIQSVIAANLTTLLPGAAVATFPWNVNFKPNYQLHLDVAQFEVDKQGNSVLRADYIIYSNDELYKKGTLYYHQHVPTVNVAALVSSMNANLTQLTRDLSRVM